MKITFSDAGSSGLYCVDDDTYDGAIDSGPQAIGHGFSEHDAFMDFAEQWAGIHYDSSIDQGAHEAANDARLLKVVISELQNERAKMDRRARHLLDRIEAAELALLALDENKTAEYWQRYPESERGKTTERRPVNPNGCKHGTPWYEWCVKCAPSSVSTKQECEHGKVMTDYCEPCGRIHGG